MGIYHIFIGLVIFDILTGIVKGFVNKEANSTKGLIGVIKHMLVVLLVLTVAPYLVLLGLQPVSFSFICFFFFVFNHRHRIGGQLSFHTIAPQEAWFKTAEQHFQSRSLALHHKAHAHFRHFAFKHAFPASVAEQAQIP